MFDLCYQNTDNCIDLKIIIREAIPYSNDSFQVQALYLKETECNNQSKTRNKQ